MAAFDESKKCYRSLVDGRAIRGITREDRVSVNYGSVGLEQGTLVHNEIEAYINSAPRDRSLLDHPYSSALVDYIERRLGFEIDSAEVPVANEHGDRATGSDLICLSGNYGDGTISTPGNVTIVELKTTTMGIRRFMCTNKEVDPQIKKTIFTPTGEHVDNTQFNRHRRQLMNTMAMYAASHKFPANTMLHGMILVATNDVYNYPSKGVICPQGYNCSFPYIPLTGINKPPEPLDQETLDRRAVAALIRRHAEKKQQASRRCRKPVKRPGQRKPAAAAQRRVKK